MRLVGSEEDLCFRLSLHMRLKYPDVPVHFDFGSGTKLTMGQAVKQKRLNKRAWPDIVIALPSNYNGHHYCGLYLELKRDGTRVFTKDGRPATPHIGEQKRTLDALANVGYVAQFAAGYDQAVSIIDSYLAGAEVAV